MSRIKKGARLAWRDESRKADGSLRNRAGWFIRDGTTFISACGGTGDRERAEKALAAYITDKYQPARERGRDPDSVQIADAVNVYLKDVAPTHAKPDETASRLIAVLTWFGERKLGEITGQLCRDYLNPESNKNAPSLPYGRRQLEDFRSAVNYYRKEGYITSAPAITLPDKPEARQRWLTRDEAAALLWAAWRMKQTWKGQPSARRTGRHVARFILVAIYTGTRSAAICNAAMRPTEGRGHVDLERGVFYRRAEGAKQTNKRQPPVKLPERLLAHMRRWASTELEIKTKNRGKSLNVGRMIAHDFIVEWNGKPVTSIKKAFRRVRDDAGLGPDVTPHVFRHTAATWLMQQGADVWSAAGFLGMTVDMLIATYGHHHPDFQADAAEAITSKARSKRLPKNVVAMGAKRKENKQPSPHSIPTDNAETNVNIGHQSKR